MDLPYTVIKNAITDKEALLLIEYLYEKQGEDPREGYVFNPIKMMHNYLDGDIPLEDVEESVLPLLGVIDICRNYFLENFKMNNTFSYKRGFLNAMQHPAALREHSDDDDLYQGRRKNEKHYSALLFLSDDYEGGELNFTEFKLQLTPRIGDLVLFEGRHHHGVNQVLSGTRVNYVIFFKDYDAEDEIIISEFTPEVYDVEHGIGTNGSRESI